MIKYKFVAELYFEAESMAMALQSLGDHFHKLSRDEVSHLLEEGSSSALGEPELDADLVNIKLVNVSLDEDAGEAV